ncbi:hypothetical protein Bpfe_013706 [Biomphalaria pfeifferi]|uniref:Uncharacterized protein n=1 Tax=Biomphalaria pfeifferi TaxID=112525 RepID=A0AAD8BMG8_BIOPF|nr:hypothetical protein Bpfe_013706 [Biomphalaria pfeifferi]
MQCYTRANKDPRTVYGVTYKNPPYRYYHQRPTFIPEPARNARPWVPEGVPFPHHLYSEKRLLVIPDDPPVHREKKMKEMLAAVNVTNWTSGRDVKCLGARMSKFSETMKYSIQSTYRDHYPGFYLGAEPKRHPNRTASAGATPTTYHQVPYPKPRDHPFTIQNYAPPEDDTDDPSTRCELITVPHYIPCPFPGLPVSKSYKSTLPVENKSQKMGWVE